MNTKIRELRTDRGMSQEQLAEKSEVSRTVISQLENDTREVVTSDTMLKIARALDCTIAEVFLLD